MLNRSSYLLAVVLLFSWSSHFCLAYETEAWQLLHSIDDVVGGGNTTHLKLNVDETVLIELVSLQGDADLYISDKTQEPSWDDFEAHSATCGIDSLLVPRSKPRSTREMTLLEDLLENEDVPDEFLMKRLKRPVYIGIYGYTGFEQTSFKLNLYLLSTDSLSKFSDNSNNNHKQTDEESSAFDYLYDALAVLARILLVILDALV